MSKKENNNDADVIKNPLRNNAQVHQKYEPEYKRLNREPTSMYTSVDNVPFDADNNKIDTNGHIIDNNEFVNLDFINPPKSKQSNDDEIKNKDVDISPEIGDYILMVFGKFILSGSINAIEGRIKSILYGEDESFNGTGVKLDDIVVLKRMQIKVGVFVDE